MPGAKIRMFISRSQGSSQPINVGADVKMIQSPVRARSVRVSCQADERQVYCGAPIRRSVRKLMCSKQPGWEGTILAFAIIFTVLLGAVYGVAVVFKFAIPWLAILILSLVGTLALRYTQRRR